MSEPRYAYVGIKPCGCWVAACMDDENVWETSRFVADLIASGMHVERHEAEAVRENFRRCRCGERQADLFEVS